ncbi:MAG: ABC transporter permease [Oligoflexus sp.]
MRVLLQDQAEAPFRLSGEDDAKAIQQMIEIRDIEKHYVMGDTVVHALSSVSLKIEEGDFVAIMGPSGSGKSTLMHVLGLLDVPDSGSYKLAGQEVSQLSESELAVMRRKVIGFIFQQFNLLPRMSATENVMVPLLYSEGKFNDKWAKELLEKVGLGGRSDHKPNELSGGQQQRVAIARSLVNRPKIIFADEPTGNLDSVSEKEIITILKELNASGITIVLVTHEDEIGHQAKRLIRMRDGEIQSDERLAPIHSEKDGQEAKSRNQRQSFGLIDLWQHSKQALKTLTANKVRTGLSMLGILIGVAAVVAMLALGRGAQKAIEEQMASLGSNLLVLRAGAIRGAGGVMTEAGAVTRLSIEDGEALKNIAGVKSIAPNVSGRVQVTHMNKNWNTFIQGVTSDYAQMRASQPAIGRFFTEEEDLQRARVAVIGLTLVQELFDGENPLGKSIRINRVMYQVIGVLPEKGATSWRNMDDIIIVPLRTAMFRILGRNYVDAIDVEVTEASWTREVETKILEVMNRRHRIPAAEQKEAFRVRNMAEIQDAMAQNTRIMTVLLSAIASISLLVGGIGIMNIMLVSVTERTKEIGLRKAVGATPGDILLQFLVESIAVSMIGGLLGVSFAWLITVVLEIFSGWSTVITGSSILLAIIFSSGVGMIFGIYPARKAAKLPPMAALRYE